MIVTATPEAVLDFQFPPQPSLSRVVRQEVTAFSRAHGVGEDDLAQFLSALGEAVANAIEHAHAQTAIDIEVRVGPERILATVHDNGVGFDTGRGSALPEPDAERGRGLEIIRRCSDIFSITSFPGKGTTVVFGLYVRSLPRVAGAA